MTPSRRTPLGRRISITPAQTVNTHPLGMQQLALDKQPHMTQPPGYVIQECLSLQQEHILLNKIFILHYTDSPPGQALIIQLEYHKVSSTLQIVVGTPLRAHVIQRLNESSSLNDIPSGCKNMLLSLLYVNLSSLPC